MVKRFFFLLLSVCIAASVGAATSTGAASTKRPTIKKVIIEENGAWSDKRSSSDETPEMCASFVLKESDVLHFFKAARLSSSHEQVHDLEVSRCYATGRAILKNGQEATWLIDRARLGVFEFADGNALYFYCKRCSRKMYWSE